jgi:hypothetical protein
LLKPGKNTVNPDDVGTSCDNVVICRGRWGMRMLACETTCPDSWGEALMFAAEPGGSDANANACSSVAWRRRGCSFLAKCGNIKSDYLAAVRMLWNS